MSRRASHRSLRLSIDAWLPTLSHLMGLAGLAYELAIDHLRNPTALMVFGGLAGLPEIWSFQRAVRRKAREPEEEEEEE